MTFDDLVQYVREEGCRVRVYKKRNTIGNARGTFDYNEHGPIICVAHKGVIAKKRIETLLHEFGHYLQYADGFMQYFDDICKPYDLAESWLSGSIELSSRELQIVRNMMLSVEYDAERRAYKQGCLLQPDDFDPDYYLKGAAAYMGCIKWSFARRIDTGEVPHRKGFSARLLTNEELYAPVAEEQLAKWDVKLRNHSPSI